MTVWNEGGISTVLRIWKKKKITKEAISLQSGKKI